MGPHHISIKEMMSYLNKLLLYQRTVSGGTTVAPGVTRSRTVDVSSWGMLRIISTSLFYCQHWKSSRRGSRGVYSRTVDNRSGVLVWCCWKHWWRSQPEVCSAHCTQNAAGWPDLLPPSESQLFCISWRSSYLPPSYSGLYLLFFL
jgi:hypothetical protein